MRKKIKDPIELFFNKDPDDPIIIIHQGDPKRITDQEILKQIRNKYITIGISKRSIIKSTKLYSYFRKHPKEQKYRINLECRISFIQLIEDMFSIEKIHQEHMNNYININNYDFFKKLNNDLQIRQLDTYLNNFNYDKNYFSENDNNNEEEEIDYKRNGGEDFIIHERIQELLQFSSNDENDLLEYIDNLNEMKISLNLPSLRNRMQILQRVVNLRKNVFFEKRMSEKLKKEIQEFQNEIEKTSKIEINGAMKYPGIIEIIRNDDSDALDTLIGSIDYNFESKYNFEFDFTGLLPEKATIFELSIFFNAVNCYKSISAKYIMRVFTTEKNSVKPLYDVPKFAFASGNQTFILFCQRYKLLNFNNFSLYMNIAIAYHNNEVYSWLIDQYFETKQLEDTVKFAAISNNIAIIKNLFLDFGANLNPALFLAFDNDNIEMLKILIQLKASDINYGRNGIISLFLCTSYTPCMYRRKS